MIQIFDHVSNWVLVKNAKWPKISLFAFVFFPISFALRGWNLACEVSSSTSIKYLMYALNKPNERAVWVFLRVFSIKSADAAKIGKLWPLQ